MVIKIIKICYYLFLKSYIYIKNISIFLKNNYNININITLAHIYKTNINMIIIFFNNITIYFQRLKKSLLKYFQIISII